MKKRPNILFIFTDQQRPDALGFVNSKIRTPHLDRLAKEGVYFSSACCNAPVCMPSRHSLFTGLYPSTNGYTQNGIELDVNERIFPHDLKAAGYWTANIGKLHFKNHSNRDHRLDHPLYGFDRIENSDEPGCYEDDYMDWVQANEPEVVEQCRCSTPPICEGPILELEGREVDEPYAFRGPSNRTHSAYVADRTISAIKDCPTDQPFFITAGFYAPHAPLNPPKELWDSYDPQNVDLPAWNESEKPGTDGVGPRGKTVGEWRKIITAYYALVTHVDEQIGKLLDFIKDAGLDDETIIVFSADHGEYLGDHGRIQKGLPGYDCVMRVPLIVRWAGSKIKNELIDKSVELVDLAPTFLDLAGVPIPQQFQGSSLKPLLLGSNEWVRDSCFLSYRKGNYGAHTIRTKTHTYCRYLDGSEVLLNREVDPQELENRVCHPSEKDVLEQLRVKLDDRIPINTREPRLATGSY